MVTKIKALQAWCRKMTEGYRDVDVRDFTVSWRDGLAFCAIIHRYRPDLIDFDSLSKENVFENNNLAFTVAEKELSIPAFLEAADMVALKTPDKLSIITYVSQYYNYLHALPQLGGPGVKGKVTVSASVGIKRHKTPEPLSEPEPKKITHDHDAARGDGGKAKPGALGDKCTICGNKVYLLERHVEGGQLYHRSCHRHSDLSPTGKVYSRSPFLSPSLHGKDETRSPAVQSDNTGGLQGPAELSRTFTVEDTSVSQKLANVDKAELKASAQKHLLSDGHQGRKKVMEGNKSIDGVNKGIAHGSEAEHITQKEEHPGVSASKARSHLIDDLHKKLAASHAAEARVIEKHVGNVLKEEGGDMKPTKRQLPLIFQTGGGTSSESAHSKPIPHTEKTSKAFEIKDSESKNDVRSTLVSTHAGSVDKTIPVAKPRQGGKKVFETRKEENMDTDEPVQPKLSLSSTPKPSPRLNRSVGNSSALDEKCFVHSVSPIKPISPEASHPPPLPSTAPPSFPSSHSTNHISSTKLEIICQQRPAGVHTPTESNLQATKETSGNSVTPRTVAASSASMPAASRSNKAMSSQLHTSRSGQDSASSHLLAVSMAASATLLSGIPESSGNRSLSSTCKEKTLGVETTVKSTSKMSTEKATSLTVTADKDTKEQSILSGLKKSLANIRDTFNTTVSPSTKDAYKTSDSSQNSSPSKARSTSDHNITANISSKDNRFKTNVGLESMSHNLGGSDLQKPSSKSRDKALDQKEVGLKAASTSNKADALGETSEMAKIVTNGASKPLSGNGIPQSKLPNLVTNSESKPFSDKDTTQSKEKPQNSFTVSTSGKKFLKAKDTQGRKERPKSAADVLEVSSQSKTLAIKTESSTPPPFMDVKLRSTTVQGGTERPKSAHFLLGADDGSDRPSWQMEAKRRMAAFRDGGFVDPETKKSVNGADNMGVSHENSKDARKEPQIMLSVQKQESSIHMSTSRETKTAAAAASTNSEEKAKDAPKNVQASLSKSASVFKGENHSESKTKKHETMVKTVEMSTEKSKMAPPKPERSWATLDAKGKEEKKLETNSSELRRQLPDLKPSAEAVVLRKKISISDLKAADESVASSPLQTPPHQPRKKISVDTKFDFDASLKSPTKQQHMPPQRPPAPKVTPSHLSAIELHQQLLDIDSKLSQLELKGRDLEDSIRSVTIAEEEDEMLMEWFKLVTEKNELVRKEADLVYQTREQTLENEQDQIEAQLRYLLNKDSAEKSFEEKEEEEYLIQRKLEIVNQRNCIVESMDEDRLRYEEEDRNVAQLMEARGFSKTSTGTVLNEKGKKVATSTFYT